MRCQGKFLAFADKVNDKQSMNQDAQQPRRGRPRLPSQQRRSERVVVMLTAEEMTALRDAATEDGLSVSSLCHNLLAQAMRELMQRTAKRRADATRSDPKEKRR